jgi:hypothetical protein
MKNNNSYFILGAPDPEMLTIEGILKERKLPYGFATLRGRQVQTHEAYRADGTTSLIPQGAEIVFVECAVMGLQPGFIIDHHHEGDPGYGKPPACYLEGSSLGQFLAYMDIEPTQQHRVIAAADHCLMHAYKGSCPGVSPAELQAFRTSSRAAARGLQEVELTSQIAQASQNLQKAERIELGGVLVAFLEEVPPETAEASAREGVPYAYVTRRSDGTMKAGIQSAPPEAIQAWMDNCGLKGVYGDPQRGFAGGYFHDSGRTVAA